MMISHCAPLVPWDLLDRQVTVMVTHMVILVFFHAPVTFPRWKAVEAL